MEKREVVVGRSGRGGSGVRELWEGEGMVGSRGREEGLAQDRGCGRPGRDKVSIDGKIKK